METKAMEYAIRLHQYRGQMYDGYPYAKHLQMVVSLARKYIYYIDNSNKDNVLAACWCHDLIEDTGIAQKSLTDCINTEISEIVFAVTNEQSSYRHEGKIKTFNKIHDNKLAVFVKLCDRIANTSNSKIMAIEKFNKYASEFPIFKYYLKDGQNLYHDLWQELENLYD